jgi:hypothetical protein
MFHGGRSLAPGRMGSSRGCSSYRIGNESGKASCEANQSLSAFDESDLKKKENAAIAWDLTAGRLSFHAGFDAKEPIDAGKEASWGGAGGRVPVEQRLLRDVGPLVQPAAALLSAGAGPMRLCACAAAASLSAWIVLHAAAARCDAGAERAGTLGTVVAVRHLEGNSRPKLINGKSSSRRDG